VFFVVVEALHDLGAVSGDGRGEQDDVGAFLYCVVVDYCPLAGDAGDFQVVGIAGLQHPHQELQVRNCPQVEGQKYAQSLS
jgi:hypothetical protein